MGVVRGWGARDDSAGGSPALPYFKLSSRPGINHWVFSLWSLDVTAGKNLNQKTDARVREINVLDPKEVVALATGST